MNVPVRITDTIDQMEVGSGSDQARTTPSIKNRMIIKLTHSSVYKCLYNIFFKGSSRINALITNQEGSPDKVKNNSHNSVIRISKIYEVWLMIKIMIVFLELTLPVFFLGHRQFFLRLGIMPQLPCDWIRKVSPRFL